VSVLRIYFNLSWGSVRTESRSFAPEDGIILAGTDEQARLPLFGFALPAESYPIAEWESDGVRLFPPPETRLELSRGGGPFQAVSERELQSDGGRTFVRLERGTTLRVQSGDQLLTATVDLLRDRAPAEKQKAMFWLVLLVTATLGGPLAFLLAGPDPDLPTRALEQARMKQGLPAQPEPLDPEVFEEPEEDPGARGRVLPTSVR
jgi:hypothetical protein